jgi:hypothetical protein
MNKWGINLSLPATHPFYSLPAFSRPFGPTDIPGCALWLDAADLSTLSSVPIPTAYFPFDNSIRDQSNVITLTTTGSVPYVTGNYGQAVSFSNAAGVATSNRLSSTYALPSTFTASMWFQTPSTTPNSFIFYTNSNSTYVLGAACIYFSGGNLYCAYASVANNGTAYPISANTWYHVAITYNSGSLTLYVNGAQSGSTVTGTNSKNGFTLGGGADSGSLYPFTGYVDDLRIFTSVLTAAQISNIYTGNTSFTSNVAGWYDKSGNGNTAIQNTLSNQPTYGTYLSYPGVYFNGANTQVLSTTYNQTGTGGRNTFIVFYDISTSPNIYGDPGLMYMGGSVAVGSAWRTQYIATSDALCVDIGAGAKIMTTSPNVTSMRTTRCIAMWAAPNSATVATTYVYGNGTQFTVQGANSVGLTTAVNTVGGLGTTIGKSTTSVISEILHYSTELTTAQRQQVEGYLAAKWGLLNNLPGKTLSPLNIPGCVLWLDVSDPSTVTSGSTVTSITDKSPNKLTTTLSSTLPTYSATQINGTPGISFTGSSWIRGNFTSAYTGSNLIVFAVGSATSTANAYRRLVSFSVPGTYDYVSSSQVIPILLQSANAVIESFRAGDQASKSISYGTNYLFEAEYTGSSNNFYLNGGSPASVASSGTFNISNWGIGYLADYGNTSDAAYWTGNFGEVVVYFGSLTTLQRQSVENYLMSKWGISNVTSHPFKSIPPSTSQPPQFQEVTPGNWTYDWKPYLQSLAAANSSGVTVTTSNLTGGATFISSLGGCLAPNGNIYFGQFNGGSMLVLNPTTGVTSNLTGGATYTSNGWIGGVLAPNGNIYFSPYYASNILVLNPTTGVTSNLTGGATYTTGGWNGAVLGPNGNIYCAPHGTTNILVLNPTTGVTSNLTGGATYTTPSGWTGGVLAPNGNIYFTPFNATNILVLNPTTGVTSNLTGGATYTTPYGWIGGVLAPNGNIYFAPFNATNILVLNPTTGVTSNLTGGATFSGSEKWAGGVLGPNGNIYFTPHTATNILVLNPTTGVTSNLTGGATFPGSSSWYTGILALDGNIYFSPRGATNILKLTFSGLSQTPSSNYCLSAWTNKY